MSNLCLALHSDAVTRMEATEEELRTQAVSQIRVNQLIVARLDATHTKLTKSLINVKVTQTIGERKEVVDMSVAIPEFEARLNKSLKEFERLRESWEEAQADIDTMVEELHHNHIVTNNGKVLNRTILVEGGNNSKMMESMHQAALTSFKADVETARSKAADEMKRYEKVWPRRFAFQRLMIDNMSSLVH
jgi:isocitrate lyase